MKLVIDISEDFYLNIKTLEKLGDIVLLNASILILIQHLIYVITAY